MNTALLKTFAVEARNLLMRGVSQRLLFWGFTPKSTEPTALVEPAQGGYIFRSITYDQPDVPAKWNALRAAIDTLGFAAVCEKAAYTWFNRLMALAILEHNGYEQPQLQYLSDATVPALLERARRGTVPFLKAPDRTRLQPLIADATRETEAFAGLITAFCHEHRLLHALFGGVDDYTELLLPADMLAEEGFLKFLNTSAAFTETGADGQPDRTGAFKKAELIGWLYQFYISERKDEVFAGFKAGKKAIAADIPAATQIFTPAWIVKYMVQNTVGRTWLQMEAHANPDAEPQTTIGNYEMTYLVAPAAPTAGAPPAALPADLEQLNFADFAAGSGHILTEAFDLFYQCYLQAHYSPKEAVESILKHNLFGLDLDPRAAGLARFAVLLKAAKHHRSILETGPLPQIYAAPGKHPFGLEEVQRFLRAGGAAHAAELHTALKELGEAYNLGSVVKLTLTDAARDYLRAQTADWEAQTLTDLEDQAIWAKMAPYLRMLNILAADYWCLAANPPYMKSKNMNGPLKLYVNAHYPRTKTDLFAVFMEVCIDHLKAGGRYAMINQNSWMFLSSYEALRRTVLETQTLESMLHLGPRTFDEINGEVVQSTAFTICKEAPGEGATATYYRLIAGRNSEEKQVAFEERTNEFKEILQESFSKIPGSPIAYWISANWESIFKNRILNTIHPVRKGIDTGKNDTFLRFWPEVNKKLLFKSGGEKWWPYIKGGSFKKWYGNLDLVVNWKNNGEDIRNCKSSTIRNQNFFFKKAITWSLTGSNKFGARLVPENCMFDNNGSSVFPVSDIFYLLPLLNSSVSEEVLKIYNPTLAFQVGDIARIPVVNEFVLDAEMKKTIESFGLNAYNISRADWDSQETSWDFKTNPLVAAGGESLPAAYALWLEGATAQFYALHQNEEELNRIFIGIYGLEDELTPEVPLRDITILQEELDRSQLPAGPVAGEGAALPVKEVVVAQALLSYAVGCAMGRYRLSAPGLHIAHPSPTTEELAPYALPGGGVFTIDEDAIVPLMGDGCNFPDDAGRRLRHLLTAVWGEATLTANLNFLSAALGMPANEYLVKHFWKAHVRTYSKKPVYWLFSSPKGAFQALVYMHRLNKYTVSKLRTKYLQPHMAYLRQLLASAAGATDRQGLKEAEKLRKDLTECEVYDGLLNTTNWEFNIDLDAGVTHNYALFKGIVAEIK